MMVLKYRLLVALNYCRKKFQTRNEFDIQGKEAYGTSKRHGTKEPLHDDTMKMLDVLSKQKYWKLIKLPNYFKDKFTSKEQ